METAWALNLNRNLITVQASADLQDLFVVRQNRRTSVTSARDALNGYQKGICFYCYGGVSVVQGSANLAEVDHFIPQSLKPHGLTPNLDGVWNLVLACVDCNRGAGGKSDSIPDLRFLKRLHARNEYLIQSHHPLRETLIHQTGQNEPSRRACLQQVWTEARNYKIHLWAPAPAGSAQF